MTARFVDVFSWSESMVDKADLRITESITLPASPPYNVAEAGARQVNRSSHVAMDEKEEEESMKVVKQEQRIEEKEEKERVEKEMDSEDENHFGAPTLLVYSVAFAMVLALVAIVVKQML